MGRARITTSTSHDDILIRPTSIDYQWWSRGHKVRSQGQGRKKKSEAKAKDRNARGQGQGPRTQIQAFS